MTENTTTITFAVDDVDFIAKRLKEIAAERLAAENPVAAEPPKTPPLAQSDYDYYCG